jgi:2-polyprenyl-3-methyl-5-hydroxy-6-metoxy-1,4-benzoquinol methylase
MTGETDLFCPVCETIREVDLIGTYRNKNKLFSSKELYKCESCGIIFINTMPASDHLDTYYRDVWLNDENIISTSEDMEINYEIQAEERVKYLKRFIKNINNLKVLDIGSGYGYLYDSFNKMGFKDVRYFATDSNHENLASMAARGINAYKDLGEVAEKDFDLITLCFVLEHVSDPVGFLKDALKYLKKNGLLFIDLPERDDTFKAILEPHLLVFTTKSLNYLIAKLGLKNLDLTGYGIERSKLIENLTFKKKVLNKFVALVNRIKRIEYKLLTFEMIKKKKRSELYRLYKYNEEGRDRWWIRAIAVKE